jgi:maltose alpha-D-glucosyltransferase/alpha-amylase
MVTTMTTPPFAFFDDPASAGPWLAVRRWYGDKSRTIVTSGATQLGTIPLGNSEAILIDLDLTFADGGEATYFVPLVTMDGQTEASDALADTGFLAWLAAGFRDGRKLNLDDGSSLTWRRSGQPTATWWNNQPVALTGEQSNSSIRFGTDAVVKVFRKWQAGVNPDIEIVEYLTEHSVFGQVPAFLGGVRLERRGTVIEVAAVQSFIENGGDSWKWLPPTLVALNEKDVPALLEAVGLLGQRTGELHAALAYGTGDAFAPEALTHSDVESIRQRIGGEVAVTVRMLVEAGIIPAGDGEVLQTALLDRIGEAGSLVGSARTRVHGDYHLGQVLRSREDFVIIDFEGEPSRSMSERREKHSPLKDVAGMLRSLDYAVATALQDVDESRSAFLREVGLRMEQAFLDAYAAGVADGPDWILPTEAESFRTALGLYMIEKALYEARYELDNRPGWIGIPFGALQRIAAL